MYKIAFLNFLGASLGSLKSCLKVASEDVQVPSDSVFAVAGFQVSVKKYQVVLRLCVHFISFSLISPVALLTANVIL